MIVISTPTGQIGRQVLDTVLDRAPAVRVIARDPSRLPQRVRDCVEVVPGSTDDGDVVTKALAGADSVLWVVPPNPAAPSVAGHVVDFARPLCEAITTQSVRRVVAVSSLGRGLAKHAGQISAIFALDDLIESTGVAYRSLQPPGFMDNLLWQVEPIRRQGLFFSSSPADRKQPLCATRDIAAVAAELLLDDSWTGQQDVPILGPEDLSHEDMARVMSDVLGRPIRFQHVAADTYRASLTEHGMSRAWAQGLVDMAAAVDRGIYQVAPRIALSSTPTSFRQWCTDVLRPAVLA